MLHSVTSEKEIPKLDVLGVTITDFTLEEALGFIHERIATGRYTSIAFCNANNANLAVTDPAFREALAQFTVLSDGVGVDIAAKLLYGRKFRANLNGTDLVPALLGGAPRALKVGLFGARPGVALKAAEHFAGLDARHDYRVLHHGYLEEGDEERVLADLAEWRPDILLVAMGVPRQEKWIAEKLSGKHCTVAMAVGALFDLSTGEVPRAPGWVRAIRSEWVYRLFQEPRRLWRRYVVGNPVFLYRVLRQRLSSEHK